MTSTSLPSTGRAHSGSSPARGSGPDATAARRLRLAAIPGFILVAAVCGAFALDFTGAAAPLLLNDSGPLGRFGLPIAEFLFNFSMSVTLAALFLATLVFPRDHGGRIRHKDRKTRRDIPLDPLWERTLGVAQIASIVWTVAAVAVLILAFIDSVGAQAFQGDFSQQLGVYISQIPYGQLRLAIVLMAATLSTLVFATRSFMGIGLITVLGLLSLVPLALMGHSAEAYGHMQAVNSIGLHLLAVVAWLGGILVMAVLAPLLTKRDDLAVLVSRFSTMALIAFAIMVYSGFVNALLRVRTLDDWQTPYGLVVIGKVVLTIILGVIGYWHRTFVINRLKTTAAARKEFWRLLGVETLIFGAVMALGVVLSRSQPPIPDEPPPAPTPAEILTSEPLPPEPTWLSYFTEWRVDPLWTVITVGFVVGYLLAVRELRRRGDTWSTGRTISWVIGMAGLFYITSGGPMVYGQVLFSGHMIQHMLLVMAVPLPMVLGAPITLLMRATKPRTDGSRGPREWILGAVHSRYLRFWAHPIVAAVNFAGSMVIFYYSGIMYPALDTHLGHELMMVHFLAAGYLFAQSLIGIDPGVNRLPYPMRLLMLLVTMTFHAFFGVSIISSEALIEPDWFGNMGHGWFPALEDQALGGEITWGIGEFPTLALAIIVAVQWSRSSDREAKRRDRSEDRSGDAELKAYNEMLAKLQRGPRG